MKVIKNKYDEVRSGWSIVFALIINQLMMIPFFIVTMIIWTSMFIKKGEYNGYRDIDLALNTFVSSEAMFLASAIASNIILILICFVLWKWIKKKKINEIGLTNISKDGKDLSIGLLLGAVSISIVTLVLLLVGDVKLINPITKPNFSISLVTGLIAFIFVGFGEEIFARGYCMSMLRQTRNKWIVIIASSLIFAALHLGNMGISFLAFINLFLIATVFAVMFMKSNNIWMPIGFHITWNYFQGYIWGFDVSGNPVNGLYQMQIIKSNIVNGGVFGPEGGIVVTIVSLILLYIVHIYYKNSSIDEFMNM